MSKRPPSRRQLLKITGRLGLTIGGATLGAKFLGACATNPSNLEDPSRADGGYFQGIYFGDYGCLPYELGYGADGELLYGNWYCDEYIEGFDCEYNDGYLNYLVYYGYCYDNVCYEPDESVDVGYYDHKPVECFYVRAE